MRRWAGPAVASGGLMALAIAHGGRDAVVTVLALGVLEVALSFDNAVVNAVILRTMSAFWQRMFLTVGIVVAVVGVRLAMPLLVVAADARSAPSHVLDLMLHQPEAYSVLVEHARGGLAAFGATFLALVTATFFARADGRRWMPWEDRLGTALRGRYVRLAAVVGALAVVGASVAAHRVAVAVGVAVGAVVWAALGLLQRRSEGGAVGSSGFAAFLALEAIDASVSVDGVLGAFALTTDIVLIAVGLGIGALFVRTLTVTLVRSGRMAELPYLEHGAYYAIGMLAVVLALSGLVHVPDLVIGGAEVVVLGSAIVASRRAAASAEAGPDAVRA